MSCIKNSKSITLASLCLCSLTSSCFAFESIFHGQSPETEVFAKKLGIEQQVFYPSDTQLIRCIAT